VKKTLILSSLSPLCRGDCQKKCWNGDRQGEGNEADPNLPGRRGLEEWWEKRGYRKKIGLIETIGGERLHNCEMGAGRCVNIVQPAK
jgi:hypothetical protein